MWCALAIAVLHHSRSLPSSLPASPSIPCLQCATSGSSSTRIPARPRMFSSLSRGYSLRTASSVNFVYMSPIIVSGRCPAWFTVASTKAISYWLGHQPTVFAFYSRSSMRLHNSRSGYGGMITLSTHWQCCTSLHWLVRVPERVVYRLAVTTYRASSIFATPCYLDVLQRTADLPSRCRRRSSVISTYVVAWFNKRRVPIRRRASYKRWEHIYADLRYRPLCIVLRRPRNYQ
jgi:hypothetical protein